ncbi:hypothetical protein NPIL_252661 [Nephila pilipes]|uniref:Uncharacterized protein n=1 Tax=Nephila pilipes TaxID=299642 RepID=A0A8X6T295_NEPPI|nr:hypothetical protein NPIL_252661 [Nephila pilipes]
MTRFSALVAIYSSVILVAFSADVTSLSTSESSLIRLETFSSKLATSATVATGNSGRGSEISLISSSMPSTPELLSRAKYPGL